MRELPQTCSEVRANLPLYVGLDLEAPILEGVASHLDGCAACRGISRGLEDTRRRIGRLADEDGAARVPDLWPGVRARLVAEGLVGGGDGRGAGTALRAQPAAGRLFSGRFRRAGFGLGAGVAAAALFGMVLLNRADPTTVTPSAVPVVEAVIDALPGRPGVDDAGTRPEGVQATPVGNPATPEVAGALQPVPVGEKSLLELQAEEDRALRADHPAYLLLRPGQVQPAGFTRPAGYDRIK